MSTTTNRSGWVVRSDETFADASITDLTDRQFRMMLILEGLARSKPFCWATNETLQKRCQKAQSQVSEIITELAAKGWLARVPRLAGKERAGFVLYRRSCSESPTWEQGRPLAEAAAIINSIKDSNSAKVREIPSTKVREIPYQNKDASGKKKTEEEKHKLTEGVSECSSPSDQGSKTAERPEPHPDIASLAAEARRLHGDKVARQVVRNGPLILDELGSHLPFYRAALYEVSNKNDDPEEPKIRFVHAYCLKTAQNKRDAVELAAKKATS